MRLHREGFTIIFVTTLVLLGLNYGVQALAGEGLISQIFLGLSLVFFVLVVQFFRNPSRNTPQGEGLIIAPADGKVVVIEEVEEPEYFKDKRKQVSIFMSPVNVHVNRAPVSGKVLYYKYFKGKYLVAWHPKSSTENERTTVVMEENGKQVLFRQIAGALARRIVCYVKPGVELNRGDEYGFIKFGSRIDLYLPLDTEILVDLNQKTVGGETIIAKW
jgi:phosphatidylserine decarboxylase